ncbi:MAG TPA: hypothetical protein VNK25_04155 [Candidatus Nitrosotenuis sp.]|jgi:putative Mn2+ efflux pump MntP|nr:hypothetical protein [Candidatus Nitrosotenuis sp.]
MSNIEIWVGFYLLMILISYVILTSNKREFRIKNDADALQIVAAELENDEVSKYEVISIVRMDELCTTTIFVEKDSMITSIELDNVTGKILNKEKLIA